MMKKNILITGSPGCGKTTLIEKVVTRIKMPAAGFLTREIREKGNRVGFSIESFGGQREILAYVDHKSPLRVGKYGVRIQTLEAIAIPSISRVDSADILVVIDEIGKMECLSPAFKRAVLDVLESSNVVLASIALRGDSFMEGIKSRGDVTVHEVTSANRNQFADSLAKELISRLSYRMP